MAAGNPKDGLLGINDMEQFANFASSHFREMQKNSRSVNAQLCEETIISNNVLSTQSWQTQGLINLKKHELLVR